MRIAQINMVHYGSTGKIMFQIAETARSAGMEMRTFSTYPVAKRIVAVPKAAPGHTYYGSRLGNAVHLLLARYTGGTCFYSRFSTWLLIQKLKAFSPDVLHLHNLHTAYLHLPMLLDYAKKADIHVVWTLHDCWAFTGRCAHFVLAGCNKWKTGCGNCPQWKESAKGPDRSRCLWEKKKAAITALKNLCLVTPSQWLASLVRQSFLKDYPIKVINNGIDLSVFKPSPSNFREKLNLNGKFVLLGVASNWGTSKGLDVFAELAKHLDDQYRIVLVGTDKVTEMSLSDNVISVRRTENQRQLAEIYSAADLFINPTREENYPTVNMEALACGTPVLTFRTGGSPEIIDNTCGSVVDCDDFPALLSEIKRIQSTRPYTEEACLKKAADFDKQGRFEEYVQLYYDCVKEEKK